MGFGSGFGVNFTASTRFKSSGGPADLDPWSGRPLSGNSDGDLGTGPNGSTYRWSSVLGEWVQSWIHDLGGTFVLRGKLDGDIDPGSESPAWVESTPVGAGSSTTDGTYVLIDTTGGVNDKQFIDLSHGVTGGKYLMVGNVTVSGVIGTGAKLRYNVHTGAYRPNIDVAGADFSNNAVLTTSLTPPAEVGNRLSDTTLASEKWVELYVIAGTTPATSKGAVFSYIDHVLRGVSDLDEFTSTSSTVFRIGDADSAVSALIKIRDLKAGTWS